MSLAWSGTSRGRAIEELRRQNYPNIEFECYADYVVCYCRTLDEAHELKAALEQRMAQCSLALHSEKTQIVYCRDGKRKGAFSVHRYGVLGYCIRPRFAKSRGKTLFRSVLPPISAKAKRQTVRGWRLHRRRKVKLTEFARNIDPDPRLFSHWTLARNGGR